MNIVQKKVPHLPVLTQDKPDSPQWASSGDSYSSLGETMLSVHAATSYTVSPSTAMARQSDSVKVSASKEAALPVTCAKLASSVGTTICCNGKECQVTINPPETPPPKKCCSSVVPKKRNRHMQEHDSEDMEQTALKTLATLRGRFLRNQKARACQRKGTRLSSSRASHRKSQCVMRCEREEVVCLEDNIDSSKEEEDCQLSSEEEEDDICDKASVDESGCESRKKRSKRRQKIDIYSVEKESIASRKTVIVNTGVTMTLEPTEKASSKNTQTDQAPPKTQMPVSVAPNQTQTLSQLDSSRESAQILAELMYHTSRMDPSASPQSMAAQAADSQAALASLAEACMANPPADPAASTLPPLNTTFYAANPTSFSNPVNPLMVTPSPLEMNTTIPVTAIATQLTMAPSLDLPQLPDLDAFSPAIHPFPSLGQVHQATSGVNMAETQATLSDGLTEGSGGGGEDGQKVGGTKKRRYPTSRPHKCSECDQAFNQPIHLRKHMSKHTGMCRKRMAVGQTLNVTATCLCITGTDVPRQVYMLAYRLVDSSSHSILTWGQLVPALTL